jgi:dipeptidyl aminopeptidase/acylaminoacyl peptidase
METTAAMDAYLLDVVGGEPRLVAENRGTGRLTDVSRDRRLAVLYRMVNRGDDNLFLSDLHTGQEWLLTPHEGPASASGGLFSPDGRTIYLASNVGREMMAFCRIVLSAHGRPGSCEALAARDDAELESFVLDEEGTVAALLWNVAGRNELVFFDLAAGRASDAISLPVEIVGGLTFSRDGRLLAMTAQGAAAPSDIWVLDRTTGHLKQVTHSPHAGVDLGSLIQPELIRFPAHDGLTLSGWLYRPHALTGPLPVVLSFHVGPESQERTAFNSTYYVLFPDEGHGFTRTANRIRATLAIAR